MYEFPTLNYLNEPVRGWGLMRTELATSFVVAVRVVMAARNLTSQGDVVA